jgi:hypothetical protein
MRIDSGGSVAVTVRFDAAPLTGAEGAEGAARRFATLADGVSAFDFSAGSDFFAERPAGVAEDEVLPAGRFLCSGMPRRHHPITARMRST